MGSTGVTSNGQNDRVTVDVLVIGAGAGGLSAAMSAGMGGLNVLIAEKTATFGGTAARSGGMLWVPCNSLAVAEGIKDSRDEAIAYVRSAAGTAFNDEVVQSYLTHAPQMVDAYKANFPSMMFVRNDAVADNYPTLPGAKDKGRTVTVPLYNGRELGSEIYNMAPPIRTMTFMGMMVSARELGDFFNVWRSRASFKLVSARVIEHFRDMVTMRRSMRLASGSALIGRMARAVFDLKIPMWRSTPAQELITENGRVVGAILLRGGVPVRVMARKGVVLATGGYPHDVKRRKALAPIPALADAFYPMAKEGIEGDGLRMAEAVGGKMVDGLFNTTSWWPVSKVPRKGEEFDLYAHIVDRSKPGFIIVNREGRRFERETAIGNDLVRAMAAAAGNGPVEGWLIADHHAMRRFGIGVVRPAPFPYGHHIRSGYLLKGQTLRELGDKCGIEGAGLEANVAVFNDNARNGVDPEFHRGESGLDKRNGDPAVKPNPSLRALEHAPYFAVKILPGDFSTLAGLRTNGNAQVLDAEGAPIEGLYAAGNDLSTMGGGTSPAGGFTLGPAVTFGYVAGKHMAGALST